MELLQLNYFLKVADNGNMTRAAEELFVSQSSLSRTIARLEQDLGVQLFDRVGRQIRLNRYGEIFLRRVRQAFIQLDEGRREIDDLFCANESIINVATTIPGVLSCYLEQNLSDSRAASFHQFFIERGDVVSTLDSGKIDFAITSDKIECGEISWEFLFRDNILALLPATHPIAAKTFLSFSDLSGADIVCSPRGVGIRPLIEDSFAAVGSKPNIVFEDNDPALLLKMVHRGIGIAFISKHNLFNDVQATSDGVPRYMENISMRELTDPTTVMDIGIAYSKARYLSKSEQLFLQSLREYCSRLQTAMAGEQPL